MHKCDGCKYKSEHQEMGFKAVGVCTKENYLPDAVNAFNDCICRQNLNYSFAERNAIVKENGGSTKWKIDQASLQDC